MYKFDDEKKNSVSGFGIASLVCGIITIVFWWCFLSSLISGILSIIFGIISISKASRDKNLGVFGLVLGLIGEIISIVALVILFSFGKKMLSKFEDIYNELGISSLKSSFSEVLEDKELIKNELNSLEVCLKTATLSLKDVESILKEPTSKLFKFKW